MKLKMHALHPHVVYNSGDPCTSLCLKSVPRARIAAFIEGVTCGNCLSSLKWRKEHESGDALNKYLERM